MNPSSIFYPSRRSGLLFHAAALLLSMGASAFLIRTTLEQRVNTNFILLLVSTILLFAPTPLLIYRAYALLRANYGLDRDGLHLRWGLRAEDIPLVEVEWVRPAANLPVRLPLPRPSWPGAWLGTVTTDELGTIEYLASDRSKLLLVATTRKVFAISPQEPKAFLAAFQEAFEMGSLSPIPAASVLPAAYLTQVWANPPARWLMLAGLLPALLLLVGVGLVIPARASISLGFSPQGVQLAPVPSIQLLLLPILDLAFYLIDLAVGLFFYRYEANRPLAFLLWGSSILTTLLLTLASAFILL